MSTATFLSALVIVTALGLSRSQPAAGATGNDRLPAVAARVQLLPKAATTAAMPRAGIVQQSCDAGKLTGGYMADAGSQGVTFLSLFQTGDELSGYWVTVKPDGGMGTTGETLPVQGLVNGDDLTLTLTGMFGSLVIFTGSGDSCGIVLSWAAASGEIATVMFDAASKETFNQAVTDLEAAQAAATEEQRYAEYLERLSSALFSHVEELNETSNWFGKQVIQASEDLERVESAIDKTQLAYVSLQEKAEDRPGDCVQLSSVQSKYDDVSAKSDNVVFRQSQFKATVEAVDAELLTAEIRVAAAREAARELDTAIVSSPYPVPGLDTYPGAEEAAIQEYLQVVVNTRADLDALVANDAAAVAVVNGILIEAHALQEETLTAADCALTPDEPVKPVETVALMVPESPETDAGIAPPEAEPEPNPEELSPETREVVEDITSILPTRADVPMGLVEISEQQRTLQEVAANYRDPLETELRFAAWGWQGNATRSFDRSNEVAVLPDSTSTVYVSIHRFGTASGSANALDYSVADQAASTGATEFPIDVMGDRARALVASTVDGNETTLYVQLGNVLIRITAISESGDPLQDTEAIAHAILVKVD